MFGLKHIEGEWFTQVSYDDTITSDAFEVMINIPGEIDPSIDAVTCNAIDSFTGSFAGKGLDRNQYLPISKIIKKTHGEFFGITRSILLEKLKVKEEIPSCNDTFWYKIDAIAHRYYIHKARKTWTTDHGATLPKGKRLASIKDKSETYKILSKDDYYWSI